MIHETNVYVIYEGDGENRTFGWPYPYTDVETLGLYLLNDHVKTIIRENFSFDPETDEFTYPIGGDPIPVGTQLLIARKTEISQLFDLPEYSPFKSEEKAHDKSIMIAQEHEEMLARSLKFEMGINADPTLPVPKPNAGIAWDEEGKKLVEIPDLRNATVEAMRSADRAKEEADRADSIRKQTEDFANAAEISIENTKTEAITTLDNTKNTALQEINESVEIAKDWANKSKTSEEHAKESEITSKANADRTEELVTNIGNPVVSVTESGGTVTVHKSDGSSNTFTTGLPTDLVGVTGTDDTLTLTTRDGETSTVTIDNVGSATKALQDVNGKEITKTYVKEVAVAGSAGTVTKGDGTTSKFAITAVNGLYFRQNGYNLEVSNDNRNWKIAKTYVWGNCDCNCNCDCD